MAGGSSDQGAIEHTRLVADAKEIGKGGVYGYDRGIRTILGASGHIRLAVCPDGLVHTALRQAEVGELMYSR